MKTTEILNQLQSRRKKWVLRRAYILYVKDFLQKNPQILQEKGVNSYYELIENESFFKRFDKPMGSKGAVMEGHRVLARAFNELIAPEDPTLNRIHQAFKIDVNVGKFRDGIRGGNTEYLAFVEVVLNENSPVENVSNAPLVIDEQELEIVDNEPVNEVAVQEDTPKYEGDSVKNGDSVHSDVGAFISQTPVVDLDLNQPIDEKLETKFGGNFSSKKKRARNSVIIILLIVGSVFAIFNLRQSQSTEAATTPVNRSTTIAHQIKDSSFNISKYKTSDTNALNLIHKIENRSWKDTLALRLLIAVIEKEFHSSNTLVHYYQKLLDSNRVLDLLKLLPYRDSIQRSTVDKWDDGITNAVAFGSQVPMTDIKIIFLTLKAEGFPLNVIMKFKKDSGKEHEIQVLSTGLDTPVISSQHIFDAIYPKQVINCDTRRFYSL